MFLSQKENNSNNKEETSRGDGCVYSIDCKDGFINILTSKLIKLHLLNMYSIFIFWLCWVFIAAQNFFSSCVEWGLLPGCGTRASHCGVSSHCRAWILWLAGLRELCVSTGSIVVPQGLAAPQHVGSSWTRDRTRVSCIGRWTLYPWATREAPRNLDLTPEQSNEMRL